MPDPGSSAELGRSKGSVSCVKAHVLGKSTDVTSEQVGATSDCKIKTKLSAPRNVRRMMTKRSCRRAGLHLFCARAKLKERPAGKLLSAARGTCCLKSLKVRDAIQDC